MSELANLPNAKTGVSAGTRSADMKQAMSTRSSAEKLRSQKNLTSMSSVLSLRASSGVRSLGLRSSARKI